MALLPVCKWKEEACRTGEEHNDGGRDEALPVADAGTEVALRDECTEPNTEPGAGVSTGTGTAIGV